MLEFAIMIPILIMTLMVSISLSHMMMIDRKVTFAAQAAADLIAQRQAVEIDDMEDIQSAAEMMMQPFDPNFDISVAHVPFDDVTGDPDMSSTEAWRAVINGADPLTNEEVEGAASGDNISKPAGAVTGPLGTPGDALVMVRMNYRYTSLWANEFTLIGITIPATLNFTKETYARPRLIRRIDSTAALFTVN